MHSPLYRNSTATTFSPNGTSHHGNVADVARTVVTVWVEFRNKTYLTFVSKLLGISLPNFREVGELVMSQSVRALPFIISIIFIFCRLGSRGPNSAQLSLPRWLLLPRPAQTLVAGQLHESRDVAAAHAPVYSR